LAATVFPAQAQQHSDLLKKALTAAAKGQCPAEIMSPLLRGTCENQMPGMGQTLAQKGSIKSTEFLGTQQSAMGPAEVHRVVFSQGSMIWMINTGSDGKIVVLWSGG
jgi:hypothetical protein